MVAYYYVLIFCDQLNLFCSINFSESKFYSEGQHFEKVNRDLIFEVFIFGGVILWFSQHKANFNKTIHYFLQFVLDIGFHIIVLFMSDNHSYP